jgi:hypothetical protein
MDNILSLQMLSTSAEQVCGQSNVSCNSNSSCLSQTSTAHPTGTGGDAW